MKEIEAKSVTVYIFPVQMLAQIVVRDQKGREVIIWVQKKPEKNDLTELESYLDVEVSQVDF